MRRRTYLDSKIIGALLRRDGLDWQTFMQGRQQEGCLWFPETRHSVCDHQGKFKSYWESHGLQDPALNPFQRSLALFGLPFSEPATETSAAGDTVVTQWFERARFEYHPNNPPQTPVLLGLLDNEVQASSPGTRGLPTTAPWCAPRIARVRRRHRLCTRADEQVTGRDDGARRRRRHLSHPECAINGAHRTEERSRAVRHRGRHKSSHTRKSSSFA